MKALLASFISFLFRLFLFSWFPSFIIAFFDLLFVCVCMCVSMSHVSYSLHHMHVSSWNCRKHSMLVVRCNPNLIFSNYFHFFFFLLAFASFGSFQSTHLCCTLCPRSFVVFWVSVYGIYWLDIYYIYIYRYNCAYSSENAIEWHKIKLFVWSNNDFFRLFVWCHVWLQQMQQHFPFSDVYFDCRMLFCRMVIIVLNQKCNIYYIL